MLERRNRVLSTICMLDGYPHLRHECVQVVKVSSVRNMAVALDHHIAVGDYEHGIKSVRMFLSRYGCASNVRHSTGFVVRIQGRERERERERETKSVRSRSMSRERKPLMSIRRRFNLPWSASIVCLTRHLCGEVLGGADAGGCRMFLCA